jgi:UDP-N-acetylglucosamine diphosphorylase/glucosamine-1-phosphate N-acetyltransferase
MNIILFDTEVRDHLLPFTFTRPVSDIRVGIRTIREKWEAALPGQYSCKTESYLSGKFAVTQADDSLIINGAVCPNARLVEALKSLQSGEQLKSGEVVLAERISGEFTDWSTVSAQEYSGDFTYIDRPWKIFSQNGVELEYDFDEITKGRTSQKLSNTNTIIGDRIFVEEGVEAECAVFNTTSGPIYLGKNSSVMEGSVIRGGLALCEHSQIKLGAKIYGPTTIGPHSKVGGEVNNAVIFGYSNKGHDGFLGNAVIGEWCNLGADTNNSNLKNNYDEVKIWSYPKGGFVKTGLQFCGLMMGDHSKCGINTMFNTGTVVGVSANIYGGGFPRNYIPSFSWGGAAGFTDYNLNKAIDTAARVMSRRGLEPTDDDKAILKHIYEMTANAR